MGVSPISQVIPESNIVVFSPHFDDVLFMLGGYILELREQSLLDSKAFHILLLFSRSNYLAGTGTGNLETSLPRLKQATGQRLLEDMECMDDLLGPFNYRYELLGEKECFVRAKSFADSEMEFPHGMYEDFDAVDEGILNRMRTRIKKWAGKEDTALVFPIAIKEHIDHFIVREAALQAAKELGSQAKARFYFQEDKPYGGIADKEELGRVESFVKANVLESRVYRHHPEKVIEMAFKYYISQVEEVYKKGIRQRSRDLMKHFKTDCPCDQIYVLPLSRNGGVMLEGFDVELQGKFIRKLEAAVD